MPAPVDRPAAAVEPAVIAATPLRLAELGACNPRIEVCERSEGDDTAGADERREGAERRKRGWLSVIGCNPRVRVCES